MSPRPNITNKDNEHIGAVNPRALSLKQLKDLTVEIIKDKEVYDEKCDQSKLPKQNMEQ